MTIHKKNKLVLQKLTLHRLDPDEMSAVVGGAGDPRPSTSGQKPVAQRVSVVAVSASA